MWKGFRTGLLDIKRMTCEVGKGVRFRETRGQQWGIASLVRQMWEKIGGHWDVQNSQHERLCLTPTPSSSMAVLAQGPAFRMTSTLP